DHEDLPEADGDSAFHREGELDTGVYTDEDSGSVELPAEMSELPGPREDDGPASADPDVSDRDAPVGGGTAESRSSDRRPGGPSSASGSAEAASAPDTEGADRGPRGGGEPSARHAAAQPATDDSAPGEIDEAAELPTAPDPGATDARGTDERTGPGTADSGRTDDWLDRLPPTARRLVAHPRYAVASAAAILGAFLLSAYAAGAWLNRSGYRALTHRLRQAREARASDDYASHREAVSLLERALAANSPGGINHLAAWTAPIAPGPDLAAARRRVRRHLLQWSAELEYRFEEPGSRLDPQQLADLPEPGESSPLALARAYRELAEGYPGRAREAIRNAQNPPGGTTATTLARISAHLEADAPGDAAAAAEDLPSGEDRTLRITYAAGRARHRTSPGEAILTIEEVLDRNEDHLDARILRISMWLDTGSRQKALERAERALRTYGPDGADTAGSHQRARLHRLRARALLAGGREDRAEAQLGRALDATPDRAGPRAALADLALDRGALTRAADRLQSAPEQLRRSLPISLVRARLALLRSHVGRAISLLEDRRRWHARSRLLAARALSAAARDEGALELLAPLADSESPSGRAASALRARLRHRNATRGKEAAAAVDSVEQLADAAPDAPFVRLQAARTHLDAASGERGDPRERHLAAAQRHLEAIPGSTEPLLTFAWCRFHRLDGAALAADRECGRARRSEVAYLPGMLAVARYHLQAGPPSEADAVAEALMARSPGDWRAAVIRIRTLIRNAQFDRAEALLDRWAGVRSADSPVYEFLEGSVSFARGDDRRAVGYLERAHRALPERPVATTRYARCLGRLGELDGAVEALEPLLDHPTRSALAWVAFGEIRRRQGRARDALQNLRIAERRAEDRIVSDRLRARLELERALASAAVSGWQSEPVDEALGRAKELSGGGSALYDYLRGRQLLAEGGLTRARSRLERALKVRPERCKFARALWRAREASGRNPQADPIDGALRRRCGL
ncbi:MAG: hypothetical protein ABEL76_15130, partial [Bradymonadaceae bacterium]